MSATATADVPSTAAGEPALVRYWFLAALCIGAGAIHLAMVPAHGAESTLLALMFGAMGWLQIGLGIALVMRPSRAVLGMTALVQLVAIGAWIVSRTWGLPFGAHPGVPEATSWADGVTVAFEGLLLGGVVLALAWEGSPARRIPEIVSVIGAVAALGATTAVLAAPSTAAHSHGGELADGHDHGAEGADGHAHDETVVEDEHLHDATLVEDDHDHSSSSGSSGSSSTSGHAHSSGSWSRTDDHSDHATDDGHDHDSGGTGTGTGTTDGHDHGSTDGTTDGHDHGSTDPNAITIDWGPSNRCDLGFNPASYYRDATIAGVDFINGPTALELSQPHNQSEVQTAVAIQGLANKTDQEYFDFLAGHNHDGSGGHDAHTGPSAWKAITDQATCTKLAEQLVVARGVAKKYPTARDAIAAGYEQVTPYIPGIGGHYIKGEYLDEVWEVDKPEMLLYDGDTPDAHVIGLSYEIVHYGPVEPDVGFAGRNDHYHRHETLCFKNGITIGDSSMTKEQCEALGGKIQDGKHLWMSHAWVVPGCESPWGIFSGINPVLVFGLDGGPGCATSSVKPRYDLRPPVPPPAPYSVAAVPPLWLVPPTAMAIIERRRRKQRATR
ncbi:MAG: hypothetical protein R2699_11015 [Acidimicrobiales bacterium]